MKNIITIHQPNYLPWLGFFHKIMISDVYVILDDVQFEKNSFNNRNRIKTAQGSCWLTVPILTKHKSKQTLINNAKIDNMQKWRKKHLNTIILNYSKSKYYNKYIPFFQEVFSKEWKILSELNIYIIKWILKELDIETKTVLSSSLKKTGKKSELVKNICLRLGADLYVSGKLGRDYLDVDEFTKEGIHVYFQDYSHPKYDQIGESYLPYMSIIDLMFNYGPKSKEIIMRGNVNKVKLMKEVYNA